MNHVEINLTSDKLTVVHDLREIRVFYDGELRKTVTHDGFADLICYDGYSYSFVGVEESASVKGNDVCFLKFYA
jgi:hypothetical protein